MSVCICLYRTRTYAEAVKQLGAQYSLPVVDLFSELHGHAANDERMHYLVDGLHLNKE